MTCLFSGSPVQIHVPNSYGFWPVLVLLSSPLIVFISYMYIISAILKMHSTEGRCKAFSTCSSHLSVVALLYMTTFGVCVLHMSTQP